MEDWEFLLQKDGDSTLLPLESPVVEVLEGRYCLIARSHCQHVPVEIRISYRPSPIEYGDKLSNKPHGQHWNAQTDAEGQIIVMPFSTLKPGLWEFRCSSDPLTDLLGTAWSQKIQLQVLLQEEFDTTEDWDDLGPDSTKAGLQPRFAPSEEMEAPMSACSQPACSDDELANLFSADIFDETETELAQLLAQEPLDDELITLFAFERQVDQRDEQAESLITSSKNAQPTDETEIEVFVVNPLNIPEMDWTSAIADFWSDTPILDLESGTTIPLPAATASPDELTVNSVPITPQLPSTDYLEYLENAVDDVSDSVLKSLASTDLLMHLSLEQETFVTQAGQSITLRGQADAELLLADPSVALLHAELRITLRDAETNQCLLDFRESLANQTIPFSLLHTISVPEHCTGHLLTGEVAIYAVNELSGLDRALTAQAFSIVTNLDDVFQEIWQRQYEDPEQSVEPADPLAVSVPAPPPEANAADAFDLRKTLNLALFELVKEPAHVKPLVLQPIQQWITPPQIHQSTSAKSIKALQLPTLAQPAAVAHSPIIPEAGEDREGDVIATGSDPDLSNHLVLAQLLNCIQSNSYRNFLADDTAPLRSPLEVSSLKQRFWSRLTGFAIAPSGENASD
jgi:hypothetical protein